eukprot:104499-Rhodomonas_salina.2
MVTSRVRGLSKSQESLLPLPVAVPLCQRHCQSWPRFTVTVTTRVPGSSKRKLYPGTIENCIRARGYRYSGCCDPRYTCGGR